MMRRAAALFMTARAFSTLDAAFLGTGVTLSADKLTAIFSNVTFQSTKDTLGRSTGKHYFEVTPAGGPGAFAVGLCKSTDAPTNGINTMADGVGWLSGGGVYLRSVLAATWGTYTAGDTICVAVDVGARLVWLRKGAGGNWNNDVIGNQNPATGIGGLNFATITGTVYPALSAQLSSAETMKINTGQAPFVGARPAGFYIWE